MFLFSRGFFSNESRRVYRSGSSCVGHIIRLGSTVWVLHDVVGKILCMQ